MADLTTQVQTDIQNAKIEKCVEVKMVDGMISAEFKSSKQAAMGMMGEWISYDKVFKTWKEFNDYADSFFKL